MDLIEEVLSKTRDFEAPKRFYYWAVIAATSAIMKDHVWLNMGGLHNLYPNIYVLLYGPSGVRKGPAISLAEDLVMRVDNTRVIDGRSSIEAVIKELGTAYTRPNKELIKDSCGFMVASELSSSIIGNNSAMDIMTNLFDRQYNDKEWKYRLKVGESSKLLKPTITWFAGTNEALFRDFIPEKNLHGGLVGRMLIITETKKARSNSLMFKTVAPDKEILKDRMVVLSKLKGEFKMAQDVREALDQWYNIFDTIEAPKIKDDTGFVSRVLDYIVKMSMIISTARRGDHEINIDDVHESIKEVLPLIVPTKRVVNSVKKNDSSLITKRAQVLTYLASRPECREERGKLLQNLGLQIDHEDLDKIAQYMIQMNVLTLEQHGGQVIYRLRTDRKEVAEYIKEFQS